RARGLGRELNTSRCPQSPTALGQSAPDSGPFDAPGSTENKCHKATLRRPMLPCGVCYNFENLPPLGARMFKPVLLPIAIVAVISGQAVAQSLSFAPTRDLVPDSKTAIAAGGAFLLAYFGKTYRDSPGYDADLKGDVWTVWERLPCTEC